MGGRSVTAAAVFDLVQEPPAANVSRFCPQTPLYMVEPPHSSSPPAPTRSQGGVWCVDKPSLHRLAVQNHHLIATAAELLRDAQDPEELELLNFCIEPGATSGARVRALYRRRYGEDPCSGAVLRMVAGQESGRWS